MASRLAAAQRWLRHKPRSPLSAALADCRHAFIGIGLFSAALNLLQLTGPVFMLEVYDRVIPSRSIPTLIGISILAAILFSFQGLLDIIRGRVLVRIACSIDETLSDNDRWKELARIITAVVVSGGNNQYLTKWVWGKIETPEMMRVDPLLLKFCYSDWASAKAIFDEINQKLGALKPPFQTAKTAYPAMQGRIGFLSFADYTRGSSFGMDICTAYGKALADNGNDAARAVDAFKAKWERDIGPVENYNNLVPDASAFTM